MFDFLREWSINIVIMSILITIVEILLPNSSIKKYIEMIVGFLIIIVIINPFINLITKDINIEREVFANMNKYNQYTDENNEFASTQNKQVLKMYKLNIKKDIKKIIEDKTDYDVKDVVVDINQNDEEYGKIKKAKIYLHSKNYMESDSTHDIKVENIEVNTDTSSKIANKKELKKDENNICKIVKEKYNLQEENIIVFVLE